MALFFLIFLQNAAISIRIRYKHLKLKYHEKFSEKRNRSIDS